MRIQLKQRWLEEQERLKEKQLTWRFSYWDGSGHQRQASVTVGDTVETFLKQVWMISAASALQCNSRRASVLPHEKYFHS
jgi:hypothetical protein